MSRLVLWLERLVGLTRYVPIEDPRVVKALEPYDVTDCPHWDATAAVTGTSTTDAVFHCSDCGTNFRFKRAPGKPWLIVGYEPVAS